MHHNSESIPSGPVWARIREGAADHHEVIAAPVGEQEGSVPWKRTTSVGGRGSFGMRKIGEIRDRAQQKGNCWGNIFKHVGK